MSDDPIGRTAAPQHYAGADRRETIDIMRDLAPAWYDDLVNAGVDHATACFGVICRANELKYKQRAAFKGSEQQDQEKAAWYAQMEQHLRGACDDPRAKRPDFQPYKPMKFMCVVAGVLCVNGRYLIGRRRDTGCWEFPGGKYDPTIERIGDALVREWDEEFGVAIRCLDRMEVAPIMFANNSRIDLTFCWCELEQNSGPFIMREHTGLLWATVEEIRALVDEGHAQPSTRYILVALK